MSKCEREVEPLRQRVALDACAGRLELEAEIAQIQRRARCVQRAAGLMAFLTAFVVAILAYPSIMLENFPSNAPPLMMNLIYALSLGAVTSLLAFAGLGKIYRKKLRQRKEACRQMGVRLFETSLGQPDPSTSPSKPDSNLRLGNDGSA